MDITFFYSENQLTQFLNSKYGATTLNPKREKSETINESLNNQEKYLFPEELNCVFDQIIKTKEIIDPLIFEHINQIDDIELKEIIKHTCNFTSWKEKSFLIRLFTLALDKEFNETLIRSAVAIELIGMSACILDDLIDESEIYDNKITTWKKFGSLKAIFAYETLNSLAFNALKDSCIIGNVDPERCKNIYEIFEKIKYDEYMSQFVDNKRKKREEYTEYHYYNIISRFPGSLYSGALEIVAMLIDLDLSSIKHIKEFGLNFAIANQIRDDVIEIIGDEKAIGKVIGLDVIQNKNRLPYILFLGKNGEYKEYYENSRFRKKNINSLINLMKKNNIIDECISHIKNHVNDATDSIVFLQDNKWKKNIIDLTNQLSKF